MLIYYLLPTPVNYHITENYIIENVNVNDRFRIAFMIPKDNPYQRISEPEIEFRGVSQVDNRGDFQIVKLSAKSIDGRLYEAKISYRVQVKQGNIKWNDRVSYTDERAMENIESDLQQIVETADKICDTTTDCRFYEIFQFTHNYITSYSDTMRSAYMTLESGSGNSISLSNLAAALGRASDIPTRQITGRRFDMSFPLIGRNFENSYPGRPRGWVEYYEDSLWHFCDPAKVTIFPKFGYNRLDGTYLAFGSQNSIKAYTRQIAAWTSQIGELQPIDWRSYYGSNNNNLKIYSRIKLRNGIDLRWIIIILFVFLTSLFRSLRKVRRIRANMEKLREKHFGDIQIKKSK